MESSKAREEIKLDILKLATQISPDEWNDNKIISSEEVNARTKIRFDLFKSLVLDK